MEASATAPTTVAGVRKGTRYLAEVEALRGGAIALVFAFHVTAILDGPQEHRPGIWVSPLRAFMDAGHSGVSLFFVLSAFLLALPFWDEILFGHTVDRRRYAIRRALRILPLYWTIVVATSAVLAHNPRDLLHGAPYLLFLQAIPALSGALLPSSSVWWSLSTEVQFYALLPFLPWVCRSRIRLLVTGGALLAAYFAGVVSHPSSLGIGGYLALNHSVLGRAPLFLIGIAAAYLFHTRAHQIRAWLVRQPALRIGGSDALLLALLLAQGLLLRRVRFAGYWHAEQAVPEWHAVEGLCWALVLLVLVLFPL
ncbi:MAG TPA: acyltransferase, partial [Chloroflexota bacterium]|nr:acyltransferase [Chloroflexota bacterium]